MRILGLAVLFSMFIVSPAAAARHATPTGQVVHTRRAPVAMHRMSPPFRGNHVFEKPQPVTRQARGERSEREAGRRER